MILTMFIIQKISVILKLISTVFYAVTFGGGINNKQISEILRNGAIKSQ